MVKDAKTKGRAHAQHTLSLSRVRFVLLGLGAIDGDGSSDLTKLELLYERYIYSSPHQFI